MTEGNGTTTEEIKATHVLSQGPILGDREVVHVGSLENCCQMLLEGLGGNHKGDPVMGAAENLVHECLSGELHGFIIKHAAGDQAFEIMPYGECGLMMLSPSAEKVLEKGWDAADEMNIDLAATRTISEALLSVVDSEGDPSVPVGLGILIGIHFGKETADALAEAASELLGRDLREAMLESLANAGVPSEYLPGWEPEQDPGPMN